MDEAGNFHGAVALVTGAAKRIGRAIALDLGRRGVAVGVHFRRSDAAAEEVASEIRAAGGRAVALSADLGVEAEVAGLIPALATAFGPVSILVNNASEFTRDEATTATRATWDLHMEANLRAPFVLTQALALGLPADRQGAVINLIDQRVWALTPHFTSYTVSKAALWTLTQTLALALAPRVRVNAIGPGPTLPSTHQSPGQFAAQVAGVPLGVAATPEEIARTVAFILARPSLTGQMIALDGGQHLGWAIPGATVSPLD